MADSGGHWNTLAQAQKLTQSMKIPGVFEEDIKRNNPLERMPVAQAARSGLKIEWLRELATTESSIIEVDIGEQLSWSEDVTYEEKEMTLKRVYVQRKLDHFVEGIYGTYNNYEARMLLECEKGMKRRLGARLVYGDQTYPSGSKQFDGYHALAYEHGAPWCTTSATTEAYDQKNIDMLDSALSLSYLRVLTDAMKLGVDELLAPYEIIRRMDAAYQEKGFVGLKYDTAGALGFITMGFNELGKRVLFWDGIPIIRTDYLVAEDDDTGTGESADSRELWTSADGDKTYSIFALKYGNVLNMEPGITFAYGGTEGQGDLYKLVRFPELEDYDAGGLRLVTYGGVLLGSSLCLGRIFDIQDVAIVV